MVWNNKPGEKMVWKTRPKITNTHKSSLFCLEISLELKEDCINMKTWKVKSKALGKSGATLAKTQMQEKSVETSFWPFRWERA